MNRNMNTEDAIMCIIFGICIGIPLGMFLLAAIKALETIDSLPL